MQEHPAKTASRGCIPGTPTGPISKGQPVNTIIADNTWRHGVGFTDADEQDGRDRREPRRPLPHPHTARHELAAFLRRLKDGAELPAEYAPAAPPNDGGPESLPLGSSEQLLAVVRAVSRQGDNRQLAVAS